MSITAVPSQSFAYAAEPPRAVETANQLSSEMMNPEVSSVHPQCFGLDSEVDRLQEDVSR